MKEISRSVINSLYGLSSNQCAFENCLEAMTKDGRGVGNVCHIEAKHSTGARFNTAKTDEERQSFDNLILLCRKHHEIIDTEIGVYTVERLKAMKNAHEMKANTVPELSDTSAEDLILSGTLDNYYNVTVTSNNQSGGQTANSIVNYYAALGSPQPQAIRIQSCCRPIGGSSHPDFRRYEFCVRVTNACSVVMRDWSIDLEFPSAFMTHGANSHIEIQSADSSRKRFRLLPVNRNNEPMRPMDYMELSEAFTVTNELMNRIDERTVFVSFSNEHGFYERREIVLSDVLEKREYS